MSLRTDIMEFDTSGNVYLDHSIWAAAFHTNDIIFRKNGKELWRMFEDEKGLYLENLATNKVSKIFLEEDIAALKAQIVKEVTTELLGSLKQN